jgi:uroporphyrinogen decarboxylase
MGLDVIHPIQKHAMSYDATARTFGGRLAFWAGLDVQRVIPWGTTADVRSEVRSVIDTFERREGRLLLGAGNAIHEDCPLANLEALLDEAYQYGTEVVRTNRAAQGG